MCGLMVLSPKSARAAGGWGRGSRAVREGRAAAGPGTPEIGSAGLHQVGQLGDPARGFAAARAGSRSERETAITLDGLDG
jgi:hypothetical protein